MWYAATVAAPGTEPITSAQAKAQLNIDSSDTTWDTLLAILIASARDHAEKVCATRFAQRTSVALLCDSFDDFARLPEAPITAVAITYVDEAGDTQTLASSVYELRATELEAAIVLKYGQTWPAIQYGSRITVTATVGFSTVPPAAVAAMLLLVGHWFRNREASAAALAEIPIGVNDLLINLRRNA